MSVAFIEADNLLHGALRDNHLIIWDLQTGSERDKADWTDDLEGPRSRSFHRPIVVALCLESCLLAVVHRGQDILLWSLESYALHNTYNRNGNSSRIQSCGDDAGALCLAFSVAPDANLLAVDYADEDLLLF